MALIVVQLCFVVMELKKLKGICKQILESLWKPINQNILDIKFYQEMEFKNRLAREKNSK